MIILAAFISLHGPGHQHISVNPEVVISLRTPHGGYFHKEVKCVIHTSDGKFISVTETCHLVERKLEAEGVD